MNNIVRTKDLEEATHNGDDDTIGCSCSVDCPDEFCPYHGRVDHLRAELRELRIYYSERQDSREAALAAGRLAERVADRPSAACGLCTELAKSASKASEEIARLKTIIRSAGLGVDDGKPLAALSSFASDSAVQLLRRFLDDYDGYHSEHCEWFGNGTDAEQIANSDPVDLKNAEGFNDCDCGDLALREEARAFLATDGSGKEKKLC